MYICKSDFFFGGVGGTLIFREDKVLEKFITIIILKKGKSFRKPLIYYFFEKKDFF